MDDNILDSAEYIYEQRVISMVMKIPFSVRSISYHPPFGVQPREIYAARAKPELSWVGERVDGWVGCDLLPSLIFFILSG